ncbi:tol-pal system protein YbgF [Hippea maritima]|uniref:Tol-pal system protein YbgF n=1 Tax=Hippea maritima (strain ATCC 700847 / DSM 10411 / MH2) TaxID=760142 RepID=F2LW18_HIPMA|nr:tol-pal system protein YbgF [Hippea maritima]AEA33952.1 tol-pal system protein YbgF [Hippea maritima DSM 10411]
MKRIFAVVFICILVWGSSALGQGENPYSIEVKVIKNEQAIKLLQQQQAQLYLKMENLLVKYGEIKGQLDSVLHQLQTIQDEINKLLLKENSQTTEIPPAQPQKPEAAAKTGQTSAISQSQSTQVKTTTTPPKMQPRVAEDEAAFDKALALFKKKDYGSAIEAFKAFKKDFKDSKLMPDAVFYLAESYFAKGEYDRAIINYDYLINTYPKSSKIAKATLKEGLAFIKMGDKVDGNYLLQKVIKQFPNSLEAKEAKKILKKGK